MRPKPIFDTNVFGDVQRGKISKAEWRYLLRHRPGRGWPLSSVTALELLAGVHLTPAENFHHVRERIAVAYQISRGRVLEDPRILLCKDVLRIPFPTDQLAPAADVVARYLDIVCRANSYKQLVETGVPYKGRRARIEGTSVLADLMAGPKNQWITTVQRIADEQYPQWREFFLKNGKRLPPEKRKELEPRSAWLPQREVLSKALLEWLHASAEPEMVTQVCDRFDAVIEFAIFVTREFLLHNYSPQRHHSDVFDHFQLQYLAMDNFVIVTGDPDLSKRTQLSSQAARIMSFDDFLQTL